VIAREHHLFLAIYLKWLEYFWRWAPTVEDEIVNVPAYTRTQERDLLRKARLLREGIAEVLAGLERKGAAAEARAMDIRLRIDHEKIAQLIADIKRNPDSRRLIVTAWNPADIGKMALPPCHCLFQFYVANGRLSCQLYQRSADIFLGVPFNIASYALLTMMVAQVTGLKPGEFVHSFGDAHLYLNHLDQAREQLTRRPYPLPVMTLNPDVTDIFGFRYEDFTLENYQAHPHIKAPVAV